MELSQVHLRYLFAIYAAARTTPKVSSRMVAEALGVSKPSVNYILETLMEKKLAVKAHYGKIYLTDRGLFAVKWYERLLREAEGNFPLPGLPLTAEEREQAALALVAALPDRFFQAAYQACYGEEDGTDQEG